LAYCVPLGIPHSVFLSWDPDDQDKALAYMRAKAEICTTCGTRQAEWDEDRYAYIGEMKRCVGCELLEMEQENVPDGEKGIKVFLVKNGPDVETSDGLP